MKARLQLFWSACSPGTRAACWAIVFISATILYAVLVYSLEHSRSRLKTDVTALSVKSANMERQASEISRLRTTARAANPSGPDLLQTVQGVFEGNGLTAATTKISTRDEENVEVVLSNLPFAQWLVLTRSLQAQQVRIDSCAIEGLPAPGMVSITAILNRPRQR